MNKCFLTGRIVRDLELRNTKNGNSVCEFTLAVNRPVVRDGERQTDFINCVVYGKQADNLSKYQQKGNLIAVEGSYQAEKWQKDGKWYSKNYVMVNNIEFLQSKQKNVEENIENETNDYIQTQIDESQLPF